MTTKKPQPKTSKDLDAEINKRITILSYLWVLCLIPLLLKTNSKFAQFHAKQGLILFVLSFFIFIPVIGQLLHMVIIVVSVIAAWKVVNGEWWQIPYVYNISKKIKL